MPDYVLREAFAPETRSSVAGLDLGSYGWFYLIPCGDSALLVGYEDLQILKHAYILTRRRTINQSVMG